MGTAQGHAGSTGTSPATSMGDGPFALTCLAQPGVSSFPLNCWIKTSCLAFSCLPLMPGRLEHLSVFMGCLHFFIDCCLTLCPLFYCVVLRDSFQLFMHADRDFFF